MARKDVRVGDRVMIKRAGEVIPFVIGPIVEARTGAEVPITPPTNCPFCGSPVLHPEGEVFYYCSNLDCPERVARQIEYFVARGLMDIEGLGERGVRQLIDAGLIHDEADLFSLKAEDIAKLEGYADKSIQTNRWLMRKNRRQSLLGSSATRNIHSIPASCIHLGATILSPA